MRTNVAGWERARRVGLGVAVLVLATGQAHAQPLLTIGDALARAERRSYANRIAAGQTVTRAAQAMAPLQGVLPALRVAGGYTRTTDPLAAFGFRLQQRAVTTASFDPASLNNPTAIGNVGTGLVLEQPIINVDAWLGRHAAVRARDAAAASEAWARAGTGLETVRAYFGAVLATERVSALEAAVAAARAHVRQADALLANGAVTRSDALLASVRAEQLESDLSAARGETKMARLALALALGTPDDTAWTLPPALPPDASARALGQRVAADTTPARERADVRAAALGRAAARTDLDRARAQLLPRINAFGRLDWNTPASPFGARESWTAGVMVSWSPFGSAAAWSDVAAAAGQRSIATASSEAAAATARLDVQQTDIALATALDRLATADRALGQSAEAHRIVSRKYDGGLATLVELLDAAAVENQSRLSFADARYQVIVAAAARRHAAGQDFSVLEDLTP